MDEHVPAVQVTAQAAAFPGGSITLLDIYTRQVEMASTLAVIHEQLRAIPDHETRLRSLERWKYALPTSLLFAIVSVAVTVASFVMGH